MIEELTIAYETEAQYPRALALSMQLDLKIDNNGKNQLVATSGGLILKINEFSPLLIDFNRQIWQKRRDAGKQQGLIRACKPTVGCKIIDATAGWGRDAAIMASFGAQVMMLERNPIMALLLEDALSRQDPRSKEILQLRIHHVDAISYLRALTESSFPDIIYIDPMHPVRQKSALVKKDLQVLQQLIGRDEDALQLIEIALKRARKKVVVKWPQHAASLMPATTSIEGKTVRFDIYKCEFLCDSRE